MLTVAQANYLVSLDKKVFGDSMFHTTCGINGAAPIRERINLRSEQDRDWIFLLNIEQSAKNLFKLTLHLQENAGFIGLLRIDFNGIHENPIDVNTNVPPELVRYAGARFEYNTAHIHVYVEGYKPLAWARPLDIAQFPVGKINGQQDIYSAILAFGKMINLSTHITINPSVI